MCSEQQIIYRDKLYHILNTEQEFIVHPSVFGMLPLNKTALLEPFNYQLHIEEYKLLLDKLELVNVEQLSACSYEEEKDSVGTLVPFTGTILIGAGLTKEYYIKDKLACFSYQKVYELVFDKGMQITTVDQSKAMQKIRKNIDAGLRNLENKRDIRCIKRFLNSSFVGDYKSYFFRGKLLKHLKNMREDYQ